MTQYSKLALSLTALALSSTLSACATTQSKDYTTFRSENPRSILVLPALNKTTSVTAPEFFLSSVSRPFGERGYYIFPAHMVKRVLEDDGLSDTQLIYNADATRMGSLFGCDAALYVSVDRWDSKYVLLATTTTVDLNYELKSCKTGATLWTDHQVAQYSPQQSNSSGNPIADLIAMAVVAAVEKGAPNYMPLAQQANLAASSTLGSGLPAGPYLASYEKDHAQFPSK